MGEKRNEWIDERIEWHVAALRASMNIKSHACFNCTPKNIKWREEQYDRDIIIIIILSLKRYFLGVDVELKKKEEESVSSYKDSY